MKNLPIGIFDSGIGGLSTCIELQKELPQESIVYFGDLLYMPYGQKSSEFLEKRVLTIIEFLEKIPCKAIIIACNTASTVLFNNPSLINHIKIPVLNVITSTINYLKEHPHLLQEVTILATTATINSRVYEKELEKLVPQNAIHPIATKEWASLIEEYEPHSDEMIQGINKYLPFIKNEKENTVLLACTHFFYIQNILSELVNKATFINTSVPVVLDLKKLLTEKSMLNLEGKKEVRVMTSQNTLMFEKMVALTFNNNTKIEIALN